jgi:hypothetical protein
MGKLFKCEGYARDAAQRLLFVACHGFPLYYALKRDVAGLSAIEKIWTLVVSARLEPAGKGKR